MRIRRILGLVTVAVLLMFVLAACGSNTSGSATSAERETETLTESLQTEQEETSGAETEGISETAGAAEPEIADTDETDGSVLIAYFSYTGNTEEVAQMIAEYTGGDLVSIQRAEEYGDLVEEAKAEILNGVHPEITVSVDSIEGYDTIFVGYPIWLFIYSRQQRAA